MPEGTSEAVEAQASAEAQSSEQISQEAEAQQEQQEESSPLTPEQVAAIKQIAGQTALEVTTPVIQSQVAKGENRVFKRIQAQFDALELNRQALGLSDEQVKEARQHIVAEAFAAPEDAGQAAQVTQQQAPGSEIHPLVRIAMPIFKKAGVRLDVGDPEFETLKPFFNHPAPTEETLAEYMDALRTAVETKKQRIASRKEKAPLRAPGGAGGTATGSAPAGSANDLWKNAYKRNS